jgi:L-fucose isomerase-like protein
MNSPKVKIGLVPASRSFFSKKLAVSMKARTVASMKAAGIDVVTVTEDMTPNGLVEERADALKAADLFAKKGVEGVVIGAMNFGNEVPAVEAATLKTPGVPVFIFACKEEGKLEYGAERRDAFCGTLSIATALRHREVKFTFPRTPVCFPEGDEFVADMKNFGQACKVVNGLKGARYAMLGPRPREFETCAFDELSMLRNFGQTVIPLPLSEVFARTDAIKDNDGAVKKVLSEMKTCFASKAQKSSVLKLAKFEVYLRGIAKEFELDGIGVQCWTSIQEVFHISPCVVMARMDDIGIPCACEVDIHGVMSMHALQLATGGAAGLADWNNQHYQDNNVFSCWHCGVFPPSFATKGVKPCIYNQSIVGASVGMENAEGTLEFEMRTGPVTIARVTETPDAEWKMLIEEGEVIRAKGETRGAHGWVKVPNLKRLYKALLKSFPHHTGFAYGKVGRSLKLAAEFMGITPVIPNGVQNDDLDE